MELRQLRDFLAVAEELSFTRAAERMHVSQPPLSQAIRALERELGARLFVRTSRSVRLTAAGEALAGRVHALLDEADALAGAARQAAAGVTGRVRMCFVGPAMDGILPLAVRAFRTANPDVTLEFSEWGTAKQIERLAAGQIDIGVLRAFGEETKDFELRLFQRDPYILVLPDDHPLAVQERPRLADLAGEDFVLFPRRANPYLHDAILAALAAAGVTPHIAQEAAGRQTILSLVAAGMGVSLLPASSRSLPRHGMAYREPEGALPPEELFMARRREEPTPAAARFWEHVWEFMAGCG